MGATYTDTSICGSVTYFKELVIIYRFVQTMLTIMLNPYKILVVTYYLHNIAKIDQNTCASIYRVTLNIHVYLLLIIK